MNDMWECESGNKEKLTCYKGRWVGHDDVLITKAIYQEGCLFVSDRLLEDKNTLRTDDKPSCPEDLGRWGIGSIWLTRVTEWSE